MSKCAAPRRASRTQLVVRPEDVGIIVGKRGQGKSTEAKCILDDALSDGWRVLAFDPHREYSRHGHPSKAVTLGPLDDALTLPALLKLSRQAPHPLDFDALSLAVHPGGRLPAEVAEDFQVLVQMVESTGDLLLCVDEVGYIAKHAADWLDFLATQSRHWGVPVIFVAQRLTQVPKTARTQAAWVVSFRQDNADDLNALAELVEDRTAPDFGPAFAAAVGSLNQGEFKLWHERMRSGPKSTPTKRKHPR